MSDLACPKCAGEVELAADASARCGRCGIEFAPAGGVAKLSLVAQAPDDSIDASKLAAVVDELDRGAPFKASLEKLLLELDDDAAERLMLVLREGRGAWHPLVRAVGRRALVLANAISGAVVALAQAGFAVTVLDCDPLRARFGAHRDRALAPGRTRNLIGGADARLPFVDASFDLVFHDHAPCSLAEARRVCDGELVLVADNRLGYKRSAGRRGAFRVPSPSEWLRDAFAPSAHEKTLDGHRRSLASPHFLRARAFALYPHSREFSHVVSIDTPLPELTIGPKERRNWIKIAAHRAGLFPVFTPSFALFAARRELAGRSMRIDAVLEALAERLDEPRPDLEQLIATRGNTAVLLTAVRGAAPDDRRGHWCLHVPLSPQQRTQIVRHHAVVSRMRREFPDVPVPEPLFLGELEGVFVACERRLGGLTAPQLTGDRVAAVRMLSDVSRVLTRLVVEPARPLTERDFDQLVRSKFELVARFAGVESTARALHRLCDELARELADTPIPRVLYHADLRSKHVQVERDGHLLGVLDWGSSEDCDLPYFDLLHLIAHERKQEAGLSAARAWRIVRDRDELREHERDALRTYADSLGLEDRYCRAIERAYPVLVGAMAEKNWDYSRPRWVQRQFDLP